MGEQPSKGQRPTSPLSLESLVGSGTLWLSMCLAVRPEEVAGEQVAAQGGAAMADQVSSQFCVLEVQHWVKPGPQEGVVQEMDLLKHSMLVLTQGPRD